MSLLMQALKKAEHAKQKQSSSSGSEAADDKNAPSIQNDEIGLSPKPLEKTASEEVRRDTLDLELSPLAATLTHPLEAEPIFAAQEEAPPLQSFNEPAPDPVPTKNTRLENESRSNAEAISQQTSQQLSQQSSAKARLDQQKAAALELGRMQAEQEKAKTVFASKQPSSNRRALWIALIGLAVVALFLGAGYYYLQIAPKNSSLLVQSLPIQTSPAPAPTQAAIEASTPANGASATPTSSTPALATGPNADAQAAESTKPAPKRASAKAAPATTSVSTPQRPKTAPGSRESESIQVRQTSIDSHINPALTNAYQFFITGDLEAAQQQYQTVLRQEPNNRDALLGMAAIALSRKQNSQAGSFYTRLLELDPADPDAIAGLTSVKGGDPSQTESRLKKVLAQNPQAGAIHFVLGNLYAQQSRWSDAQQSYFRAVGAAPNNTDYAFNLAVSLDRLNQEKLALEFYQRALSLAQNRPGNFNKASVQDRIKELQAIEGSK